MQTKDSPTCPDCRNHECGSFETLRRIAFEMDGVNWSDASDEVARILERFGFTLRSTDEIAALEDAGVTPAPLKYEAPITVYAGKDGRYRFPVVEDEDVSCSACGAEIFYCQREVARTWKVRARDGQLEICGNLDTCETEEGWLTCGDCGHSMEVPPFDWFDD